MCEHCKTVASKTVAIDEGILDVLIEKSGVTPTDLEGLKTKEAPTPKLTFEPNENIGEGGATSEELAYRQELLDLLKELYEDVNEIINQDKGPLDKIRRIDFLIDTFISDGQDIVNEVIPQTWDDGVDEAITTLEEIDDTEDFDTNEADTEKLDLILQQQLMNIEDIGLRLRGRIRQSILVNAIQRPLQEAQQQNKAITKKASKKYPASWTPCMIQIARRESNLTEDELREQCIWESGFIEAEENTDKTGVWGWIEANKEALLAGLIMGAGIVGDLIADWATCEDLNNCPSDGPVCDECQAMSGETYYLTAWPGEPHFGCRCGMDNIRLA